ncbi:hypothetical protein [Ferruginibacter sp.]
MKKPTIGTEYKIWIDEKMPNNSIVLDAYGDYWKYSILMRILFYNWIIWD